jgi:hypothetical protein
LEQKVTRSQSKLWAEEYNLFSYIMSGLCHNRKVSNGSFQDHYQDDFTVCGGVWSLVGRKKK